MKRYLVQTFGCQMNVHDSRRIEEVLGAHGYEQADELAVADVIVLNTCSVREKAEQKLRSMVGTYKGLKALRPDLVIVVAGCVAQQEGDQLLRRVPHLDLVIGPDNIAELPALVEAIRDGAPPRARTVFDLESPRFLVAQPRRSSLTRGGTARFDEVTSFVTVMKGCDERCTYCIVPYTRGPERYRPAGEIVAEIAHLVEGGVREITLLGQTVNSWHSHGSGEGESEFPSLLRRIALEVPSLLRLRYTSPHPRHLTEALIDAHASLPILPRHLHLPVQSGSDRMLKRMLRRYTREGYLDCVDRIRKAIPGVSLTTDIIVGFPGETDAEFEETLEVVRQVGFMDAFTFIFSPRDGTPATRLPAELSVPADVAGERLSRLVETVRSATRERNLGLLGSRREVLVEREAKRGEAMLMTRTRDFKTVLVPGDSSMLGQYLNVEITGTTGSTFTGSVVRERQPLPMAG